VVSLVQKAAFLLVRGKEEFVRTRGPRSRGWTPTTPSSASAGGGGDCSAAPGEVGSACRRGTEEAEGRVGRLLAKAQA
jgi:hypothetical protein